MESVVVNEFPRTPLTRSQRPTPKVLQHTQPPVRRSTGATAAAAAVVLTDSKPVSHSYEHYGDDHDSFEFTAKEKDSYKQETKVSVTEDSGHHHHKSKDDCHKKKEDHCKKGYSNTAICLIMFVIFIIVFFVVLGGLWYCQPECTSGDGDGDFNYVSGALYAFLIALFFIIIIGAAWWACS